MSDSIPRKEIKMGGQAVIEGVMMRAAEQWAVAVRKPDGEILVHRDDWKSPSSRYRVLRLPVLRGSLILLETLFLGVKALSFSAEVAASAEVKAEPRPSAGSRGGRDFWMTLSMVGTVATSLLLGIGLFFYLPLVLTDLLGVVNPLLFNVVDGLIRVALFLVYLLAISRWSEIRRVFQYHGAEHMVIAAYEDGRELEWEQIRRYSRFHPRCGTSFILVLMLVSIMVFMFLGKPDTIAERLVRMLFIPLIGGISYEMIKLGARYPDNPLMAWMVAPGLWLQRITTLPPDESQAEVAATALRAALGVEEPAVAAEQLPAVALAE